MKFELSFTDKEITPWDGAYGVDVILESFITGIWCEAKRFLHTEITRADRALGEIFGWERTPAQDAYKPIVRRTIFGVFR